MPDSPTHPDTSTQQELELTASDSALLTQQPLSQHVFRALFDQAADCLVVYDVEGRIVQANSAFSRLMARLIPPAYYQADIDQRADQVVWRDAQGRPLAREDWPVQRVLRGETLSDAEAIVLCGHTPGGSLIYLSTTGAPLRNEAGQIVGAVCTHRDVTEYQRLKQELTARVRELEAMYEAMTDGVLVFDQEGRITFANRAFRALFGLVSEEDVARFSNVGPPGRLLLSAGTDWSGRPLLLEEVPATRLLRGEVLSGPTILQMRIRALDDMERFLSVTGAPLRDENGQIVGAVAVFRDVTEQRREQEEQEQLLNFIAHELNTPLTTLKGQTQLARRRLQRGEPLTLQQLERIENNIVRMERLVGDLLDSARLEKNRVALDLTTLDLGALCGQVAEGQSLASGRPVQLDLPQHPVLVRGDALRLTQVLTNLLSNALKYSPVETEVVLRLRQQDRLARVEVEDHGPGIAPEAQPRLFDRFYRAPGTRVLHGSGVGLGLGLYLSRWLVRLHDGEIGVSSSVGKGSAFWFTLPLSQENAL